MGDLFENIINSTIINKSIIGNSSDEKEIKSFTLGMLSVDIMSQKPDLNKRLTTFDGLCENLKAQLSKEDIISIVDPTTNQDWFDRFNRRIEVSLDANLFNAVIIGQRVYALLATLDCERTEPYFSKLVQIIGSARDKLNGGSKLQNWVSALIEMTQVSSGLDIPSEKRDEIRSKIVNSIESFDVSHFST